jgi:hypothetical protein
VGLFHVNVIFIYFQKPPADSVYRNSWAQQGKTGRRKPSKGGTKMIKRTLLTVVVVTGVFMGTQAFAGAGDAARKAGSWAFDAGGMVNSGSGHAQNVCEDPALKEVEETTQLLGIAADIKDVASVGTTGSAIAGASGSGIMSTLASGAVIGSGVVVGAATTGGLGGLGAASLMNRHVFNGDTEADEQARTATYAGAAVGTAASVGALVGAGAGPAGLAAIGAMVGGGMAAGAVTVLAAPAVAAVAAGAAIYWLFK